MLGGNDDRAQVVRFTGAPVETITVEVELDATDALAVALCHHYQKGNNVKAGGASWGKFLSENPDRLAASTGAAKPAKLAKS